jgi:hypothetical protein
MNSNIIGIRSTIDGGLGNFIAVFIVFIDLLVTEEIFTADGSLCMKLSHEIPYFI